MISAVSNRWARQALGLGLLTLACASMAGCSSTSKSGSGTPSYINTKTKFSVAEYGVAASPRVTMSKNVPKGGGRDMVGKPYKVRGKWYTPKEEPGYDKAGIASWYGPNFHGRLTANGEIYDQFHLSGAHPTFPLPSYARVTNKKNGHSVIVRINDRGPYSPGRIVDVSSKAAELLEMKRDGIAAVRVEYVGRAPVHGDDMSYLMASYRTNGMPGDPNRDMPGGVMMAMNGPSPSGGPSLPGVGAVAAVAPPAGITAAAPAVETASVAMIPQSGYAAGYSADTSLIPASFRLPDIGPVPPDRPSVLAAAGVTLASGYADVGLAYRGGRVTRISQAFDHLLAPGPSRP
ncbi:rare lipoprotein A [Hoeflea marina]|uniref:Endolytic peptidoglycan transglycosylase RlpA n=1 Tax=Hoeflea marina TaxID=274592 RepID=A0A317PWI1_9HYPH|nr:septal ring lytic transglycosylase RlpA family protein [Hoeflea marina]PWW03830.1 rare lipoprotein A [Hoeflea marina]